MSDAHIPSSGNAVKLYQHTRAIDQNESPASARAFLVATWKREAQHASRLCPVASLSRRGTNSSVKMQPRRRGGLPSISLKQRQSKDDLRRGAFEGCYHHATVWQTFPRSFSSFSARSSTSKPPGGSFSLCCQMFPIEAACMCNANSAYFQCAFHFASSC